MSRIGKLPIVIPAGVEVKQEKNVITVKGPKGELSQKVDPSINVKIENGEMVLSINEESPVNIKQKQAFHGLYRSLVNNMVVGVSQGSWAWATAYPTRATLSSSRSDIHTPSSSCCRLR